MSKIIDIQERVIDPIGTDRFFPELMAGFHNALSLDYGVVFKIDPSGSTDLRVLSDSMTGIHPSAVRSWSTSTYQLYPTYKAIKFGTNLSVHTAADLNRRFGALGDVPDEDKYPIRKDSREEMGFVTLGATPKMQKLAVFVDSPRKCGSIAICMTREKPLYGQAFRQSEVRQLHGIRTMISKLVFKHLEFSEAPKYSTFEEESFGPLFEGDDSFTSRQVQILNLIFTGHSSGEIADSLCISLPTVKYHRRNIYRKLKIKHVRELHPRLKRELARRH